MKCSRCEHEYPSAYHFKTPSVCNDCFEQLTEDEQAALVPDAGSHAADLRTGGRSGTGRKPRTIGDNIKASLVVGVVVVLLWAVVAVASGSFEGDDLIIAGWWGSVASMIAFLVMTRVHPTA